MSASVLDIHEAPFPVPSKTLVGKASDIDTVVSTISWTDRLVITVSQEGRLAHWVHVPLSAATRDSLNPIMTQSLSTGENALLPRSDLTATTVLGGTKSELEIVGQTLATIIASAILVKRPSEDRLLVLGLGLAARENLDRDEFEELVGLVLDCL